MYYYDGRMMCPRGYILRSGYTTKNNVVVRPTCVKDMGKKGKGPKLIPKLKKGLLTKYGYSSKETTQKRHSALKKAAKEYGAGNLVQKLNSIYVLNRGTNPKVAATFNKDKKWVMKNLEYDGAAHGSHKRKRKSRSRKRTKSKKRKSRRKRSKSKSRRRRSMKQGYIDRKDESIAMRRRKRRSKKQLRDSANESYGRWGSKAVKSGKINRRRSRSRRRSPKSIIKYRNLY